MISSSGGSWRGERGALTWTWSETMRVVFACPSATALAVQLQRTTAAPFDFILNLLDSSRGRFFHTMPTLLSGSFVC
jgi:hypothetical protein